MARWHDKATKQFCSPQPHPEETGLRWKNSSCIRTQEAIANGCRSCLGDRKAHVKWPVVLPHTCPTSPGPRKITGQSSKAEVGCYHAWTEGTHAHEVVGVRAQSCPTVANTLAILGTDRGQCARCAVSQGLAAASWGWRTSRERRHAGPP